MNISYLSPAYEAMFSEMIREQDELSELFGALILQLQANSDYDDLMISFEDSDVLRVKLEYSPYLIIMDQGSRLITLNILDAEDEVYSEEEYDFDDDGIDLVVDVICSRIEDEDWYSEMTHHGY